MAKANFFDKSALSAAQILAGVSPEQFHERLEGNRVVIAFSEPAVAKHEGRVALELLTNLLARLLPAIGFLATGDLADAKISTLTALAKSINPDIDIVNSEPTAIIHVGLGTAPMVAATNIYVGSDGWRARVSTRQAVKVGGSGLPFGAAAAACFAAANLFRSMFADNLPSSGLDEELDLSLFTYDFEEGAPPTEISIDEVFLVGIGAIGNGAIWTLARTVGATGRLHLIDNEVVDPTNLQRYVLTDQTSKGVPKVELAAAALAGTSLNASPYRNTWGEFLSVRNDYNLTHVAVALDSVEHRIEVQGSLPYVITNAWTRRENLGVSRHRNFGSATCLACLYIPIAKEKDRDEVIAEALEVPERKVEVRRMLHSGAPVSEEFLAFLAAKRNIDIEKLRGFVGRSVDSLYTEAACGGVLLKLGVKAAVAEVPMAFQSALAGVMLAAELAASGAYRNRPTRTLVNVLRPLPPTLSFQGGRKLGAKCICEDATYHGAYLKKWAHRAALMTSANMQTR